MWEEKKKNPFNLVFRKKYSVEQINFMKTKIAFVLKLFLEFSYFIRYCIWKRQVPANTSNQQHGAALPKCKAAHLGSCRKSKVATSWRLISLINRAMLLNTFILKLDFDFFLRNSKILVELPKHILQFI